MDDNQILHFLAGEVNGMRRVMMALVNTHPDPEGLLMQIERLTELQVALTTPLEVTEPSFIIGQDQTTESFRARVVELIATKPKPGLQFRG